MTLRLDNKWIWDFWFAWDGSQHHVFYLQAPKDLDNPDARHWNTSIGHAVSTDLVTWETVRDALLPGPAGTFDDYTTWTGSVVAHRGGWAMLYTGTSHAEDGLVQRIGLAVSDDLFDWRRSEEPVLPIDPAYYETLDTRMWHDQAWRDPWLFFDPGDQCFHTFLTARSNHGPAFDRGVIGHAKSTDLLSWTVLPPISAPDGFGQLEVPQLVRLEGRWYLLFSSDVTTQSPQRREEGAGTGTYYMVSDSPYGPFRMIENGALDVDQVGSTYSGKIHSDADGTAWFFAWNQFAQDGHFIGELASPRRLYVGPHGALSISVDVSEVWEAVEHDRD